MQLGDWCAGLVPQVGLIKSTEVDIQNKLSDQTELRKNEDKKANHWTKEVAKKRTQLAASFPNGEHSSCIFLPVCR